VKLLLDENLPHQMRLELSGHDVFTVAFMGWSGVENGELLHRAATAGFDAVVTNDRGLEYEQNLAALPVAVVVVLTSANTIEALRLTFPALLAALSSLRPCEFVKVSIP
jgi:hypothetical protein